MSQLERLLVVQEHQTATEQLRHRIDNLPERAELRAAEAELAQLNAAHTAAAEERHAQEREQKRLEDDVAMLEDKITKTNDLLYGGTVKSAGELVDLQTEIESFKRRQGELELGIIELMEAEDPVDARLADYAAQIEATTATMERLTVAIAEAEATLGAELDAEEAARIEAAADIDPELLDRYEKLRSALGYGVARLVGGVCGGCHLSLSAVEIDRVKHLEDKDEIVVCTECMGLLAH